MRRSAPNTSCSAEMLAGDGRGYPAEAGYCLITTGVPLGSSDGMYSAMCMGSRMQPWLAG